MLRDVEFMAQSAIPGERLGFVGAYAYVISLLERYNTEEAKRELFMSPCGLDGTGLDASSHATAEERDEINAKMARLGFKREEVGFEACFAAASIEENEKNKSTAISFLCGCEKTVIRFFAKRITCKCLEEKYQSVKAEAKPKAGMCACCQKCDDRKCLRVCTGCNLTYCELLFCLKTLHNLFIRLSLSYYSTLLYCHH